MAPYYRIVTSTNVLPLDNALLETMEKQNQEELEKLDQRLKEAEETEGETDIADALRSKANYLTRIGEKVCANILEEQKSQLMDCTSGGKDKAVEAQKVALEKTPGLGQRIDIVLTLIRIGLFFGDQDIISTYLAKAEEYATFIFASLTLTMC